MPLLAKEHIPIPIKDLISWCYENRGNFDQDKPIYVDCAEPSRSFSANQTYTLIRQLVAGFRAAGLKRGDVVCLHSFNNVYYPLLVQGIIATGGVFVGTNPSYTTYELTHTLKISKAKFLIVEPELLKAPREAAAGLDISDERILLLAEPDEARSHNHASWRTLTQHGEEDWVRFSDPETAKNTPACLLFSSGTTGLPKAAVQSHYNIIAEHTLVHENPSHPETYHMSRIIAFPLFHTSVLPYVAASTLRSGRESYIMRRFVLPDFLTYTHQFQATNMMLAPPMVVAVIQAAEQDEAFVRKCLRSIKAVIGGAAPLDARTQARLQALLPKGAPFTQIWAMTELTCIASYLYHPESDETGSVGRFMPNIDVKLADPDAEGSEGKEVGPYDTRGEMCVRGPTVIKGYLDNPEANARDWDKDGFFHTGDIMYCDGKTGLWYVVDRKKELIKVRGFQVAPNEIEAMLLEHPGINDAAVIGIPDAAAGSEKPRAYIVASGEGKQLTEEGVKEWIRGKLARYKELSGGVKFVESIPKTPSGKILKRTLREEAKKELEGRAKL